MWQAYLLKRLGKHESIFLTNCFTYLIRIIINMQKGLELCVRVCWKGVGISIPNGESRVGFTSVMT